MRKPAVCTASLVQMYLQNLRLLEVLEVSVHSLKVKPQFDGCVCYDFEVSG